MREWKGYDKDKFSSTRRRCSVQEMRHKRKAMWIDCTVENCFYVQFFHYSVILVTNWNQKLLACHVC
jgi:hypothetical protein